MSRRILVSSIILALATMLFCSVKLQAVSIVPEPRIMTETKTAIRIPAKSIRVYAEGKELEKLASTWAESLQKPYAPGEYITENGFKRIVSPTRLPKVKIAACDCRAHVRLFIDHKLAKEQYILDVNPEKSIEIKAGSTAGVWWGLQTLSQILIESAEHPVGSLLAISGLHIEDYPAFSYRSAMLDCVRHFFSVDEVKNFIDILALHKLNTFHWHLTDDQGWRIEIKKYPELTKIGAWRDESPVGWNGNLGQDGIRHGGFYTQEEIKEVIAYAAERQISIIPEIEMPGHAQAALASYNYLGCLNEGYKTWTKWGISREVFCIGKESSFEFLEGVLDEVCELFPGKYIHIGGDECPRDRWKECPDCQKRMQEEGLKEFGQLQGYLLKRIEKHLNSKGKQIIGWDEILDSGVTPTAAVMSWRGAKGGIKAAKMGNKVVMAPNDYFYFDYYQTADPQANKEPLAIGGYVSLNKSWSFNPYDQIDENSRKYIWGIQANTWAEYIASFDHIQWMDLPRFCALSSVAWNKGELSYEEFASNVKNSMVRLYEYYGLIYAPYAIDNIK